MQLSLLDLIICPECKGDLRLEVFEREASEILEGSLLCGTCGPYPISRGVPRLTPARLGHVVLETAKTFGWQWKQFTNLLLWEQQREQFLDWVHPLQPDDFVGSVMMDAGCGMGRLTEIAASFGPEHIIGVDLSSAVDIAFLRLRGRPNVHVVQADLRSLPFRTGAEAPFDLAYSIGVLHHLPDPREAYEKTVRHVAAGGRFAGWVYGAEGNEWITNLVDPVRRAVTSRLPGNALLRLSTALSVPLHAAARSTQFMRTPEQHLPYGDYLKWLGRYDFRHTNQVVFDHLGPPVAHYTSRDELQTWFDDPETELLSVSSRNSNSWRFLVRRGDSEE